MSAAQRRRQTDRILREPGQGRQRVELFHISIDIEIPIRPSRYISTDTEIKFRPPFVPKVDAPTVAAAQFHLSHSLLKITVFGRDRHDAPTPAGDA
jgi:hypothetical protein